MLLRLIEGQDVHLRSELLRRFREERATAEPAPNSERKNRRTVVELLAAAEKHAEVRRREEAESKARERARRQREEAEARAKHLDSLKGREEEIWLSVESLIEVRQAREYDQALQHLHDLRDLAKRSGGIDQFRERAAKLRAQNPGKQGLLRRLDQAGM